MKYDFKNLTIKKQLALLLGIFVILAVVNFMVLHHFIDQVEVTRKKALVANQLPEKIKSTTQLSLEVTPEDEPSLKQLQKGLNDINNILSVFNIGGFLPNHETHINAVKGEEKKNLRNFNILWDSTATHLETVQFIPHTLDTIKQDVVEVPNYDSLNTTHTEVVHRATTIDNPEVLKAKSYINANTEELVARADLFVQAVTANYELAKELLNYTILIVVVINFIVMAFLLLGIRTIILSQINQLDSTAQKLSEGQFEINEQFEWKNEISKVGEKINQLGVKLTNATEFVKKVGQGELDTKFEGIDTENISKSGLEAALLNMRDQMKRVEEEEKIRKWSTGGLAKFVEILRTSDDDVTSLCDKIISNLVDYTHSNQGGLYLVNDEDSSNKHLELISLYAFNTKKYDTKTYRFGEGLVGQTFLERKTTYLLEIPNEYIEITSGLGGANPKAILVVPLQVNNNIFGILELASFEEFESYEIEFIEKLGESIASTIASVKNNQRTKRLLEESQELTEQMQAQEEEMRQNMEELSATQEEMARKEIEITAQLTAINNSLGTVEYDIEGIITNTNAIFTKEMGYSTDQLYDSAFSTIYEDNKNIWPALKAGDTQTGVFKFKRNNGSTVDLQSSFTPIKNDDGEVYKIIQLITSFGVDRAAKEPWEEEMEDALKQNLEELEITQEQLNNKLKLAEEKLNSVNEKVKIITINAEHLIENINSAANQQTGYTASDLTGKNINTIIDGFPEREVIEKDSDYTCAINNDKGEKTAITVNILAETSDGKTHVVWV